LSSANSASVALLRIGRGIQRDRRVTPASRAFLIAGTMAFVSLGVIRIAFAPAVTMFSIAVTWPALSPSNLPAALMSLAPLALAASSAPSFILTKKGFVSVFVIRPTTGCCAKTTDALHASNDARMVLVAFMS
jgi:hypothetical protein